MKQFLKKCIYFLVLSIIPPLALFLLYIYFDPFKILKDYNDYSYPAVIPNRDYISTSVFINNYRENNYNSFILGSSRTLAFKPKSWQKYLSNNDNPFMFDASSESIYGIYTKLKYLDYLDIEIKNILIILCRDTSFENLTNQKGHLFIKSPITSGESEISFHLAFLKAYYNLNFLVNFYSYKLLGEYKPFMYGYIENRKVTFDTTTNEISILDQDVEITKEPNKYYEKRKHLFYERTVESTDSIQRISKKHIVMLKEIKQILEKNNTNYKVILSPLYEQIKFNPKDLLILENIFSNHLYDFSGKNQFTENITNYYETSHYRPTVGNSILSFVYKKKL